MVFIICMTTIPGRYMALSLGLFIQKSIQKKLFRMFLLKYGILLPSMIPRKGDSTPGLSTLLGILPLIISNPKVFKTNLKTNRFQISYITQKNFLKVMSLLIF